jgi:cell fate regulator YaaT (PSP1 superfamily)
MTIGNPIYRGCPSSKMAGTCAKLEVFDWLKDVNNTANPDDIVEIRFKNTRKDYYLNVNKLSLELGDIVAVEASPGHDIGMVSLTGDLVLKQMRRHKYTLVNGELRKVYRKAKPVDIEKWEAAMQREHETMIRTRKIAADLNLNMKIGDVEYQGDATKAIFYYIADDRVDFRQLIKVLAENFHIRVEMKQIGARQEAGRIGGIGPCGRELCCSTWMSSFSSVTTSSARYQEISLNPQKLAGQCSKLKCCLNYEVDCYLDEQKGLSTYQCSS